MACLKEQEQYKILANSTLKIKGMICIPSEGWVRTIRKALDMSGAQLAQWVNLSRNRIYVLERREVTGDITLNQLRNLADKLGCQLTYALVPKEPINLMLNNRAEYLAIKQLASSFQSMVLESQSIDEEQQRFLIEEQKANLLRVGGRELWKTKRRVAKD
jgi:predicted DNA-binding mobile mystery protein A